MPTVLSGSPGTGTPPVTSGAGKLLGILISHAETTPQTVTLYDNTAASGTVLLTVTVAPERSPFFLLLPRDLPIKFTTGLAVAPGSCVVNLWLVAY